LILFSRPCWADFESAFDDDAAKPLHGIEGDLTRSLSTTISAKICPADQGEIEVLATEEHCLPSHIYLSTCVRHLFIATFYGWVESARGRILPPQSWQVFRQRFSWRRVQIPSPDADLTSSAAINPAYYLHSRLHRKGC
jgi:hypothetical protein